MMLTTEDLGEYPDISSGTLDEVLSSDGFGKFAVLVESEKRFIQVGNDWQPNEATSEFLRLHESDPWVLEYREDGQQFRAVGQVTLEQVRQAFQSFLSGGADWRSAFTWNALEL
jgi:hypothetical protein